MTDLTVLMSFPTEAPYRIDQVTNNPGLMLSLAIGQLFLAGVLSLVKAPRIWWTTAGLQLITIAVFFTLASWGTSDIARFSHHLAINPNEVLQEPAWIAIAPLITTLPYRLAFVHGLVSAGFALIPLLLARHWRRPHWGGWWALLVVWSPLLRNFLQNGVTRQALATLLITPLLLRSAGWSHPAWLWVGIAIAGSGLSHNSLAVTAALAVVPLLTRPALLTSSKNRNALLFLAVLVVGTALLAFSHPAIQQKLNHYLFETGYYNTYGLRNEVLGLELTALIAVLLTVWRAKLNLRSMAACHDCRTLLAYTLMLGLVQLSMATGVLAPIVSRCLDPIGLFWLLALLAWTSRHHCAWTLIPVLAVVGESFIDDRILSLEDCIGGDQFMCPPDRWPWQINY